MSEIATRTPIVTDGLEIWRLVSRMGGLELNSCYAYVLLCSHFAETCLVAERAGKLVGFVAAYRPPSHPTDLFVWQVGVAPEARGLGVGSRLLDVLIDRPAAWGARFLTATVSPDNAASLRLFNGFATRRQIPFQVSTGYPAALFAESHADEDLVRIGPLHRK